MPLALFLGAGWTHRWIADDGFIYLRVVRQITSGNGPVFNSGERVEAFTSPLWVAILSIADIITPIRLEWLAVGLGLGFSVAGLGLAVVGARTLRDARDDAMLVPFGLLVFVALLPAWVFQTSGLETGLTFAWEGGCLAILAGWAGSETRRLRGYELVILGLGWLVGLSSCSSASCSWSLRSSANGAPTDPRSSRARRDDGRVAARISAVPNGLLGSLVANTAIAKEGTVARWGRGWDYFLDFGASIRIVAPCLASRSAATSRSSAHSEGNERAGAR